MKKTIIAIIAIIIVAALGVGSYFLFFDDNGSEGTVTAVRDGFVDSPQVLEALATRPERYTKVLETEFQMGEKKTAEFYECPEEWLTYEQLITIYNNSEDNITVYGIEIENNGKNGVYVSTSAGGELSIAPGGNGPASFSVLCDNGDLSTDEAQALAEEMKIKVIYSKTPTEYDDGTESVEETKTVALDIAEAE